MSNFIETFKDGKDGKNFGLDVGIPPLTRAINGLQRKMTIGVAAAPKCGKTTLVDYCFVLSPYLQMLKLGKLEDIEWIYFSYEIDRISKEFKYAAFFMYYDFGIFDFSYKGIKYLMNQDYLMGKMLHENPDKSQELIPIAPEHEEKLKEIYYNRIVPIFGEFNGHGIQIKPGKIKFIEESENPTGLDKFLKHHARKNGTFVTEKYTTLDEQGRSIVKERITGYTPNNPNKFTIVVTDHIRKLRRERGFSMKENIDKWLEYSTSLRNICSYTFIHVIHSNRNLANIDRLKYAGEYIFPTADDCKDSGNPAEECSIFMTLFDPNNEKYNLKKHFGVELGQFPNYRSIHITESRYTECPVHIQTNMFGGINLFGPLFIEQN